MIKTIDLVKKYNDLTAVNKLNLWVKEGEFYGLLGPNGAGKTTTLKMLSMLLNPSDGQVYVKGEVISRKSKDIKSVIGVVPQHFSLQREMNVKETLVLHGYLHKMKRKVINRRMKELLTFADMTEQMNKPIEQLSGGNKRKLMIIRSMMHKPEVLFLDEPTVGLDASIRRSIWDLLKKLKTEGLTIILTTHYIEEANILCDRIGMMSKGQLIKENTPKKFLEEIQNYVIEAFDGESTDYHYFDSKEEASEFSKKIDGEIYIRKTNLEDVYVKYTNERMDK